MIPWFAHVRPKEAPYFYFGIEITFSLKFCGFCYFSEMDIKLITVSEILTQGLEGHSILPTLHDMILVHFIEFLWHTGCVTRKMGA